MTDSPRKGAVYVLEDPRLEGVAAVGYAGFTGTPWRRLSEHLSHTKNGRGCPVNDWIRSLQADGVTPTLRVVEDGVGPLREGDWIAYYRKAGAPICNEQEPAGRTFRPVDPAIPPQPRIRHVGRRKKAEGEHYLTRSMRFPPDLWRDLQVAAPDGQRSAVVLAGLRRELDRLERLARQRGVSVGDLVLSLARDEQRERQIERLKREQSE